MFIISLRYIAPLEEVDVHRSAHIAWLKIALAEGGLLLAGRNAPAEGGTLIVRGVKNDVAAWAATDPFVINGVAVFDIVEFAPSMTAPGLELLIP